MNPLIVSLSKILYHGTDGRLQGEIDPEKGSPNSDFGRGFYLTESYRKAKKRGKEKAAVTNKRYYYVIPVIFDDDACFNDPDVTHKEFIKDKEWFEYVMKNRLDPSDEKDWMVVIGPSIDGRTKQIIKHYENRGYYPKLLKESGSSAYGEQYCFKDKGVTDKYLILEPPRRHWRLW